MKRMIHHLRRNRTYSHNERWGVFAAMFALTVLVSAGGWFLFGAPAMSATSITVTSVEIKSDMVKADGVSAATATITLADKENQTPVADAWVGIAIPLSIWQTDTVTHEGWYSPETGRSFYQTDANGRVSFAMKSQIADKIRYDIYIANPELKNDNKYQKLDTSFWVTYQ